MQIPFEVYNNSGAEMKAILTTNSIVQPLVSNLNKKKAYISTLNFSDELIPKFIPEYIHGSVSDFRNEIYNYILATTSDIVNYDAMNDVPDYLMTPYYVMCRYTSISNVKKYYIQYIKHIPTIITNTPSNYPSNKMNYYENTFYYYYDFGLFLQSLESTFNSLLTQMADDMGVTFNNGPAFSIIYNNSTITYNVNQSIVQASGNNDEVMLFMSNNLRNLLSFQALEDYNNLFSSLKLSPTISNGYVSTQIPLSIVKICTVKQIIVNSNMPCQNVQFYSNNKESDEVEEHRCVLMLYYNTSSVFGPSQTASYDIAMPIPYIYFTNDHFYQTNSKLNFSIWLRLNNSIMIQHVLKPGDYMNLVLRLELSI